jgi:O-antigen/teichoic acid export membrane protein
LRSLLQRHRRIATETAWVFGGQGAAAVATLVGLRLITELVPPAAYGMVALALGVIALAHGLAAGPLMQAVLRFYPDLAVEKREGSLRQAAIQALRKPVLLSLASLVVLGAVWSLYQPQDVWLAVFSLVLFVAEVARSVEITFLNAARRQRTMALLMAADAWLRPLAAVTLVWIFGASGTAVVAGYLAGCVLALAGLRIAGRATGQLDARPASARPAASDIPRRLLTYAVPLTALPFIGWVSGQADRFLVGGLASVAAAGLYAALYGLASKPFLLFSASVELALRQPYYASASAGDHAAERRALALWLAAVTGVSLALWLLFVLFHAEIAALLLAAEYRAHSALMAWIAAGYVLLSMAQVFERVCYAHYDTRGVLWVEACGAALSVLVAAPLVYAYGIEGAAWAVPVYFGTQLLIAAARARHAWRRAARSPAAAIVPIAPPTAR